MKVAVACDDRVKVALHTGRCRGIAIYEVNGDRATRLEYRDNEYTAHAGGGCGGHTHPRGMSNHSHAPLLDALGDCAVLVTGGLGERLIRDLASRNIETYLCGVELADEAAAQFAQGMLPRAEGHGGCGCHR